MPNTPPATNQSDPEECIVISSDAFILRVSSYFGMAPLRFDRRGRCYAVSLSNYMLFFNYLLFTVLMFLLTMSTFGLVPGFEQKSKISILDWIVVVSVVMMTSVGIFGASSRMRGTLKLMRTLASVDKSIGAQYSYKRERRVQLFLILFLFFVKVLSIDDLISFRAKRRDWGMVFHFSVLFFLRYLVTFLEVQFCFIVMSLRPRFQAVNETLCLIDKHVSVPNSHDVSGPKTLNMLPMREQTEQNTVVVSKSVSGKPKLVMSPSDAVLHIALIYRALQDEVHRINDSYGVPLVIILLSHWFHLVIIPYFFILDFGVPEDDKIHFVALNLLFIILHISKVLLLVEPCHYVLVESGKTQDLVCRMLLMTPTSGPLRAHLELLLQQLMMQPLSFNVMGLWSLDRTLLTSIFGAVVTFLVILLQLRQNSD